MLPKILMQETHISGLDVWVRSLSGLVGEESWEDVDLPFLTPSIVDILHVLPETQWNIGHRRFLDV